MTAPIVAHLVERAESDWFVQLPSAQPGTVVRAYDRESAIDAYCKQNGIIRRETHEGQLQVYVVHQVEPAKGD
jgi:hypothetical protein